MEIDEGAKIARRVDSLRSKVAQEDMELKKFREASIKKVQEEINSLISNRDVMVKEVEELTEKKRILQIPLDDAWKQCDKRNIELTEVENKLTEKAQILHRQEVEIESREYRLKIAEEEILDEKTKIKYVTAKASDLFDLAQGKFRDAEEMFDKANHYFENKKVTLVEREMNVAARERTAQLVRDSNDRDRSELNKRERLINDKYETLLRTEKRLNK